VLTNFLLKIGKEKDTFMKQFFYGESHHLVRNKDDTGY